MLKSSAFSRTFVTAITVGFLLGGVTFKGLAKAGEVGDWPQGEPLAPSQGLREAAAGSSSAPSDASDLPERLTSVFVNLAREVTPAVVQVEVRRPVESAIGAMPEIPEPFRGFFRLPQGRGSSPQSIPEEMAGGTGFVITPDGYILTNAHVVNRADRIMVNLVDRTSHAAELVGVDLTTDLAIIKIQGQDLPTLNWGSSSGLEVGEPVMAVGNPGFSGSQSLDHTVTTGIVSALGRPLSIIRQSLQADPDLAGYAIENFIQTDAVINPGNSGGPLVDLRGLVVGVNSAIASSDGHYQGYGFAIPADLAQKVSGDLMEHGKVLRGWLGVSVTEISAEDAQVYKLPRVGGVLVQSVDPSSPAKRSGLSVEDVVMALDGHPLEDSGDLQELVAELGPGARTELEVYRNGQRILVPVHLGDAPLHPSQEASPDSPAEGSEALLGMAVGDLTREMASELGYAHPGGIVVTAVVPWSSAMRRGITAGMRIEEVDHTPVLSAREFRQAVGGVKGGDLVTIRLGYPDGNTRIVNLRAESK